MKLSRTLVKKIPVLIILSSFFVMFLPVNSTAINSNSSALMDNSYDPVSASTPEIRQSVSSEEENIDSFDVNPKSGRWDVTETGAVDDRIIDGNLRLITTENDTGSDEYFMERGLQKTDTKIDYRYKAIIDNQSQVEYFRDVLGDSADFEEGDQEGWLEFIDSSKSVENGIFWYIQDSAQIYSYIQYNVELPIDGGLYHTISFRTKIEDDNDIDLSLRFRTNLPSDPERIITLDSSFSENDGWTDFSYVMTQNEYWIGKTTYIAILFNNVLTGTKIFFDEIKFIGDLDYATHVEGEVEDTWDWEDSLEYFYDDFGNVSDFNDGTTEGWSYSGNPANAEVTNLNSEYLNITDLGNSPTNHAIAKTSLSIVTGTYKWLTIEFSPTTASAIDRINITDGSNNEICDDTTGWTGDGTFYLFTCDLSLDGDYTGTETGLKIVFWENGGFTDGDEILINMVYLYDTELGDLETYTLPNSFAYLYVDPNGFFVTSFATSGTTSETLLTVGSLNIPTARWDTLVIRIKGSSASTFEFNSNIGTNFVPATSVTTSFQTFSFDLDTVTANWAGTIPFRRITFRDDSGTFEGDERWTIDYILLLNSDEQEQDFTVGFWDQDNSQALVNVTHHFFNSTSFRWEIEMYDSNQEIASYFYSSNYSVAEEYYRISIDYDFLESQFEIEVRAENNSQLFDENWRSGFTTTNDNPAVFAFEKTPHFYVSTYTVLYGHQEVWIDYFNTEWTEAEWRHTTDEAGTGWLADTPQFAKLNGSVGNEKSLWTLTTTYLDQISTQQRMNRANFSCSTCTISSIVTFSVIDKDDGEAHRVFTFRMSIAAGLGSVVLWTIDPINDRAWDDVLNNNTELFDYDYGATNTINDFSIALLDDRNQINLKMRVLPDENNTGTYQDIDHIWYVDDYADIPSQEFQIQFEYDSQSTPISPAGEVYLEFNNFDFIVRDIFEDIGAALGGFFAGGLIGLFLGLFSPILGVLVSLFLFLSEIWKVVGKSIVDGLKPVVEALEPVIEALGTLLKPAIDLIRTTLSPFLDGLEGLLGAIDAAIGGLAAGFVAGFLGAFNSFTTEIVNLGATLWNLLWTFIFDTIDGTGDLGDSIDNLWTLDIGTMISDGTSLITFTMSLFPFVVIFAIFFIFSLPFLQNDGDVYKGTSGMFNNAFRGVSTPHVSLLGFGGKIVIPFIVLVYIAMKLLIAAGTFPDVFGGLPI